MMRRSCFFAATACVCFIATAVSAEQLYRYSPKLIQPEEQVNSGDGVVVKEIPIKAGDTLFDLSHKYSGKGMYYPQILLFNDIKDPNKIYAGETIKIPLPRSASPSVSEGQTETVKHHTSSRGVKTKKRHYGKVVKKSNNDNLQSKQNLHSASSAELSLNDLKKLETVGSETKNVKKEKLSRNKKGDKKRLERKPLGAITPRGLTKTFEPTPAITEQQPSQNISQQSPVQSQEPSAVASPGQKIFEKALKAYRAENFNSALELFDRFLAENPKSPLAADANLYKAECYLKLSSL